MLSEICQEIRNWFDVEKVFGTFSILDSSLTLDFLQDGQYFRIVGSVFNDGVYQYPVDGLKDETFDGAVWALAFPPAFLALADSIKSWNAANAASSLSPYISESKNNYSYTRAQNAAGGAYTWKDAFAPQLNRWRKIR